MECRLSIPDHDIVVYVPAKRSNRIEDAALTISHPINNYINHFEDIRPII